MSLLAVGLSHRTTPVDLLERAVIDEPDIPKILTELLNHANISEAMLLVTCNRVEVYAAVETFHGGLADISRVLARHSGINVGILCNHLYVHYAAGAAEHLFRVAAGLDSMVLGETQILGQLRAAYAVASSVGTVGSVLHKLVQDGLRAAKRVHAETGIDHAGPSVVAEALADASAYLGGLVGRKAVLVGAGSMGALAATHLRKAGIGRIAVANRTLHNAERLAKAILAEGTPAVAVTQDALPDELATADVIVACTGAHQPILHSGLIRSARRQLRPLAICDLGLPRDVAPEVASLPAVRVIDLASLQERLRAAASGIDCSQAAELVAAEVRNYLAAQRSAEVTPTVAALRRSAAEVVDSELLRLDTRLPDLDPDIRTELARTVRRVVDKLLHTPTVRVKQLAEAPGGVGYADALRELFALDQRSVAAISTSLATGNEAVIGHKGQSMMDGAC